MRFATLVLVAVVAFTTIVLAQPARKPPPLKVQAEMSKLEKELLEHQAKTAPFAAVKVAKKLYQLRKKELGPDEVDVLGRRRSFGPLCSWGEWSRCRICRH